MQNPKGCWRMCIAAALALFCALGLNINAFSVFIPYLTDFLSLSYNQSSAFLMVRSIFSIGSVYFAKYYYDKLDIRIGYSLILLLNAIGFFLYANAESFTILCASAVVSGLCNGFGGMYPVAILIHRWFPLHESLAMGICAASSGLAITIGAPILTALTENYSMKFAMYCEGGFFVAAMIVCFVLIRNYPEGELHYTFRPKNTRNPLKLSWTIFAIMTFGMLGGGFSYLTIHYTTEGFDPYQVSLIVSVIGLVLTGSKFLLGELLDLWGAYRVNWIYLSMSILSCAFFCMGGRFGFTITMLAAVLYGVGDAIVTVGVSAYAKDLSRPEAYATMQQQFQTAISIGGLICTLIAGPIATATGNYRAFYLVIAVLMFVGSAIIQFTYWKKKRR